MAVLPSVINTELEEGRNFIFVYLSLHLTGLAVLWNGLDIGVENLCSPAEVLSRVRKKTKQLQQQPLDIWQQWEEVKVSFCLVILV